MTGKTAVGDFKIVFPNKPKHTIDSPGEKDPVKQGHTYALGDPPKKALMFAYLKVELPADAETLFLKKTVEELNKKERYDRLIVITDEQAHDSVPAPNGKGYVINVASYRNGVGYGAWTHIDGWSEAIIEYIRSHEQRYA